LEDWMKLISQHVVYENDDFIFELDEFANEEGHQMLFVHLTVHQWSRKSLAHMLQVWRNFRAAVPQPVFAAGRTDDEKFEAFCKLFGLRQLTDGIPCEDGASRRVFIHELKDHTDAGRLDL
jgi:hypothetical protein